MKLNLHYQALGAQYLFSEVAGRVARYKEVHPGAKVISLGIGDVTQPLAPAIVEAIERAASEMANANTFHGYGPEQGYPFLREAIASYYAKRGINLAIDEIFISDGAKSDLGNILDLFSSENTVWIPDPVYPVYVDTNQMAGRNIRFLYAGEENGFLPMPDWDSQADIIYLCSPNNPTGAVYSAEQLTEWVEYARQSGAVILFDAAYERFIEGDYPHSIFEIEGARSCAIEFCSFSKMAGFTGTRCGWTVVPEALRFGGMSLRQMWLRRQTTKFNGVPYIVQRGAEAVFTPAGWEQTAAALQVYQGNAKILAQTLDTLGIFYTGGKNSPYLWMKCPGGASSWSFFDDLLQNVQIVGTPGAGFGKNGEGFFRLTAFGSRESTERAAARIGQLLKEKRKGA